MLKFVERSINLLNIKVHDEASLPQGFRDAPHKSMRITSNENKLSGR